jgi:hypothetical protein
MRRRWRRTRKRHRGVGERERERHSISMIRRNVSNMMACTIEKRSTKTLETTAAEIVRIISQPASSWLYRETATDGRTDGTSLLRIFSLALSYWPRVIMSCLLGDLPARLVFLFYYFFSVLFGGRPSLRFLAQLSGIWRGGCASCCVIIWPLLWAGRMRYGVCCSPASHHSVSRWWGPFFIF